MTKQLSILGNLRTCVNFSPSVIKMPTATPISKLPKNTIKNIPMASNMVRTLSEPTLWPSTSTYFCAVSNSTIAIASFRIDSPKMTVYSFGSTLYALKMARMVTGSVAESVAPTENASMKLMLKPYRGMRVDTQSRLPRTTVEMKVPAKAKVRIGPMFRKKFAYMKLSRARYYLWRVLPYLVQLVSGGEDDWREQEVEEKLIVEGDNVLYEGARGDAQDEADDHAWGRAQYPDAGPPMDAGLPAKMDSTVSCTA